MAQRVSRAKQRIREAGATFSMPPPDEIDGRLRAVLHVLYLIFNEGYTTSSGAQINRTDLTGEAIRLTRQLHRVAARRRRGPGAAGADAADRGAPSRPRRRVR